MITISFVNMKGGVGKTTLAVNVAHFLANRESKRVLLVDLDPQFNATQCLVSPAQYVDLLKKGADTIYNVFNDQDVPRISIVRGARRQLPRKIGAIRPHKLAKGFDLLLGDLQLYQLDMGGASGRENRLKRYLEAVAAQDTYDIVIIDSPPTPSAWMTSALLASDCYLVPVKPEPLSQIGMDLLRGVINRCTDNHGHDIECLGLVLTIADARTQVFSEAVEKIEKDKVWKKYLFSQYLPKRTKIAQDQGSQVLILDARDNATKTAMTKIVAELLERLDDSK